jgi:polyisoprenyl-teichoic acid--peptidoglycan teichoic acid transferase
VQQQGLDSLEELERQDDDPGTDRKEQRSRGRRAFAVLLVLVLLLVGGVVGFVGFLFYKINGNITQEDLLPADRSPITAPDGSTVPETGEGTNFLVIGADTRPGDAGRSDVIVLVHLPEDGSQVQLIHFPRDLYVDIPGRGKDKINAAYAYGREPLLVETMEELLKIRIHHVARTDLEGFRAMTDAVGGVRVYAEEASDTGTAFGQVVIKKGWNDLNGDQALGFVRERKTLSEGDISRGRRQLAFIKALLLKATSPETVTNPIAIAKFANAATDNLVVDQDLSIGAMKDYALSLKDVRGDDVIFSTAPFSGFGTAPNGGSIDVVDEAGMERLGDALRTDSMDTYEDTFVTP